MVCYVYDCNYVKVIPIKSRSVSEWVKAYDHIHQELTSKGFKPKPQTIDSEASAALKHFSPPMTWSINWCRPTVTAATLLNAPSELSKNTLWQNSPQSFQLFYCTCGTDFYPRRKSHKTPCGPRDSIHSYPPRRTFMASWIKTKQLFLLQGAKSLHMRNQESDALGHPTGNMDTLWAQQCITTGVKMSISLLRLANASWKHVSFPLTTIRCHICLPLTD
jgi:hypothetical protein